MKTFIISIISIRNKTNKTVKLAYFYENDDDLIDPTKLDKDQNHIMVFDDVMLELQTSIKKSTSAQDDTIMLINF